MKLSVKRVGGICRKVIRNRLDLLRLKNKDFSILTNHCMGGIIYHDLGLKFLSPTINLKILPDDFIRFLEDMDRYLSIPLKEVTDSELPYPVGALGDITVYFVHYHSFAEANAAWEKRKQRINKNNLRIMMTTRDGCSPDTLTRFEALPYEHKVFFSNEPHKQCQSCHWARLDNGKPLPGYISDIVSVFGKRAFQCNGFDYIRFLNRDKQRN